MNYEFRVYLLGLLFLSIVSCKKELKPALGDEFYVETFDHKFTSYKVVDVNKKMVWYVINDYKVSDKNYIDSIFSKKQYTDTPIEIKRKEFNNLPITFYKNEMNN